MANTANQPRIAIIGAGKIAEVGHIPGFRKANAPVVAICARGTDNLNRVADHFQIERRYTDWQQMLSDGGFEAVAICTPPSLHRDMTITSLEHSYHVLLEKPIAVTLDECDDMITAVNSSNCLLMLAHNQRFRLQHITAKKILDSGQLGQVRRVHTTFAHAGPEHWSPNQTWYFNKDKAGFGVLLDLGYHKIDLLRWLLGQEVKQIHTIMATFEKPTPADDSVVGVIQFDGGTLATLQASWAHHPDLLDSVVMFCEHGTLKIPSDPTEPVKVIQDQNGKIVEEMHPCDTEDGPAWFGVVQAFVDAIRHEQPSPVSAHDAKATLEAVLIAYSQAGYS